MSHLDDLKIEPEVQNIFTLERDEKLESYAIDNCSPDKVMQGRDNWTRPSQDIPKCKHVAKYD